LVSFAYPHPLVFPLPTFGFGFLFTSRLSLKILTKGIHHLCWGRLGFIETYVDPWGARAEWEGFVAVVNKELSAKYTEVIAILPSPAPNALPFPDSKMLFISLLMSSDLILSSSTKPKIDQGPPWPSTFEVDEFRRPDFTALEIVNFATGGIPAGTRKDHRSPGFVEENMKQGSRGVDGKTD